MKSCITCGMPLEGNHANDVGLETPDGPVCKYDVDGGTIKSGEAIFEGGVAFFASETTQGDRELAERLTRKNMQALPYWQSRPFAQLTGAQATDEEFSAAMEKLSNHSA